MALKTYNKQLFDKAANEINLCCNGMKEFNPVFTETNLQFTNKVYDLLILKNFQKFISKVLTAISCPLTALDRFT